MLGRDGCSLREITAYVRTVAQLIVASMAFLNPNRFSSASAQLAHAGLLNTSGPSWDLDRSLASLLHLPSRKPINAGLTLCCSGFAAGHKSPEIMALNPRGQVPTFNDNGIIVNESLAILLYLEEAYPSPTLMPGTPGQRAQVCALPCTLSCQHA